MNEKSFPMLAGLVALLLVVLLALSFSGRSASVSPQSLRSDAAQAVSGSGGNAALQTVQLPYPVPSTVEIK